MNKANLKKALHVAEEAAGKAGNLMLKNFRKKKVINESSRHDIKLELDVKCQEAIEKHLLRHYPSFAILGEEGTTGDIQSEYRWVVDPIDGTVNFTYDIPHANSCIALQKRVSDSAEYSDQNYQTILGVVLDPFTSEMWTATKGGKARLNKKIIRVSGRKSLKDTIITMGFAKSRGSISTMLPVFEQLSYKVRKVRMMGAAALSMSYVASGRFDAYLESGVRIWDIAAGGIILEEAGGDFCHVPVDHNHTYRLIANNGLISKSLKKYFPESPPEK